MNQQFCELVGLMAAYLERNPADGADRLKAFMADDKGGLWDTSDVMEYTGWGRSYIQRLVSTNKIPYIPGKPHKFVPKTVKAVLEEMQVGGSYGRRRSILKSKKEKTTCKKQKS